MPCLFGDSTATDLELDYIEFLRDFFGFAVDVLIASERIDELSEAVRVCEDDAASEKLRLDALHERLRSALAADEEADGASGRCAAAISRAGHSAIEDEARRVDAELARERALADRSAATQRKACERALERLLLAGHTLPESDDELELALAGEHGYGATMRTRTSYGLEAALDLDIPEGSLFATVVRASQVAPALEVHLPETRGWLSKKVKQIKHKLGKHVVTGLRLTGSRVTVSLRSAADASDGFELILDADWATPRVLVVQAGETPSMMEAHDLDEDDAPAVRELLTTLVDSVQAIRDEPRALSRATLDNTPIAEHEDPTLLIDRMIELMAPTVRAIASHSLADDELVLKRSLGGDRREEVYISKRELREKLDALEPVHRECFRPLGLWPAEPPQKPPQARKPAPPVRSKAPAPPPLPEPRPRPEAQPQPRVVVDPSLDVKPPATRKPARAGSEA